MCRFQPRQNLLNAASRVGEASTSVLYTIGEETEEDKQTQVTEPDKKKKSFLYRKLNYCYDNFYNVFFSKDKFGDDFDDGRVDDGVYEDVDVTRTWGLDAIQEESDSDYYRSLAYCDAVLRPGRPANFHNNRTDDADLESIIGTCVDYLDKKIDNKTELNNSDSDYEPIGFAPGRPPRPPPTVTDKIYNFKNDFSNHDYANINYDTPKHDYSSVNLHRRTKNDILRQRFFLSNNIDKNDINDRFNRYKDKKIECHSIRNDVTKSGPDVSVAGALNLKILNPDRYNRVLTTKETFYEESEASFTKTSLSKLKNDRFENFVKKSEKYYTSSDGSDRKTEILNNSEGQPRPKTEIRIVYNPTFRVRGGHDRGARPCSSPRCCQHCQCFELELQILWKENWLNILCILSIIFVIIVLLIQWLWPYDCDDDSQ